MSESKQSKCGPHTTIAVNDTIRVSQCSCGTYHLNFLKRGLSFQLNLEDVQKLSEALNLVARVADAEGRCASLIGEDTN